MEENRPEEFRSDWNHVAGSWIVVGFVALIFLGYSIAIRSIEYEVSHIDSNLTEADAQVVSK